MGSEVVWAVRLRRTLLKETENFCVFHSHAAVEQSGG